MQLVPNQLPQQRLIVSMDAPEKTQALDVADSPFVLKGAGMMSGNSRWIFIGALIGAMLLSIGGIIFTHYRDKNGESLRLPTFVKARTQALAGESGAPPAPIIIQLSADMVRVSAIALGHPRLANSAVALILRIVRIGDGSIDLTDGKQMFSAKLTIPSPPKAKTL